MGRRERVHLYVIVLRRRFLKNFGAQSFDSECVRQANLDELIVQRLNKKNKVHNSLRLKWEARENEGKEINFIKRLGSKKNFIMRQKWKAKEKKQTDFELVYPLFCRPNKVVSVFFSGFFKFIWGQMRSP